MRHYVFIFVLAFIPLVLSLECPLIEKPTQQNELRREIFIFSTDHTTWKHYRWDLVTTVVWFHEDEDVNPDLLCAAHALGVKVSLLANYPADNLTNAQQRKAWATQQRDRVLRNQADGLNFDMEYPLDAGGAQAQGLTALVQEVADTVRVVRPQAQITYDVAWSPECIDGRCYDYAALAQACDFLFVMDYDMRSQIYGPCTASANAAIDPVLAGLRAFTDLGIPANKLVMGVPWYGYDYPCLDPASTSNTCEIRKVPFRGAPCSDAAGKQRSYVHVQSLLHNMTRGSWTFDSVLQAPSFRYQASAGALTGTGFHAGASATHVVWYDDPMSITAKGKALAGFGVRGAGCWNADQLDYCGTPEAQAHTDAMWDALLSFTAE